MVVKIRPKQRKTMVVEREKNQSDRIENNIIYNIYYFGNRFLSNKGGNLKLYPL
jgi:hypothetical protein